MHTPRFTRRQVIDMALAGTMATALAGACRPAQRAEQSPAAPEKVGPATLELWTIWGGTRLPLMEQQFERFSQRYPGLTVQHTLLAGDRLEKILTAMAGGVPPDVPMIGRQEIPLFVETADGLLSLDGFMLRDRIGKESFYEAEIDTCVYNGKTWGVPLPTAGTYGCVYYNRDWLTRQGIDPDKAPLRTWEQLEELAQRLTQVEGGKLVKLGFPMEITGLQFWHWLGLTGGKLWSDDGRQMLLEKGEETLQWMADFRDRVNGGRGALQGFPPGGGNAFYDGYQAHTISGVWQWFVIKTEQPEMQAGVYLRPSRTGDAPRYLSLEAWAYGISKASKVAEAAWLLVKFLTTDKDGGGWFMQQQGRPSPVKAFNQAPEMKQLSPYWDILLKALEQSVAPGTFLPVHQEVVKAINTTVAQFAEEQLSARDAAAAIRREGQRIIDEFWALKKR
jgi:multiple sugar transport system substrate-binding protein